MSPILATAARIFTPGILLLSVYLLLRGHDAPGGGFIAALVAGTAVVLRFLSLGAEGARRLIVVRFTTLLGAGLLLAVGSGLAGLAFGREFLASTTWKKELPLLGEVKVASSLAFDVGVALVVVGVVAAVVEYLGREEE